MGNDGLLNRYAHMWRELGSPSSPLYGYRTITLDPAGITWIPFIPSNSNRIAFYVVGTSAFQIRFPFMKDSASTFQHNISAGTLTAFKTEDWGILVQQNIDAQHGGLGDVIALEIFIKR